MNICFIMYPWENVDPEVDSTLRLIHEAVKRKHQVAYSTLFSSIQRFSRMHIADKDLQYSSL